MSVNLSGYDIHAGDWRAAIKSNQRHTIFVLASFIVIYLFIGLILDLYLYSGRDPTLSLTQLFILLATFKIIPYATIIAGIVAIISIMVTFIFHDKFILLCSYHL